MDSIVITDIFGKKLSTNRIDNLPFILLHKSSKMMDFDEIANILYDNRVDPSYFAPLGNNSENMILVNKDHNISRAPINYVKIGDNLWKPIPPKGYRALNNIISAKKPSMNTSRTVNKNLVSSNKSNHYMINKEKVLKFMKNDCIYSKQKNVLNSWTTQYGKHVALIQPENPWYTDKEDIKELDKESEIEPTEKFNTETKKSGFNFSLIVYTLLAIIILLIIIRFIINWKNLLNLKN